MIPTNRYSVSSPMPLDLNHDEDQNHQLFSTNHEASSSTSSLLYPILLQPGQGSYHWEPKHLQSDEEAEKNIPSSGSWEHPAAEKDDSVKWMSSKMRMMPRMMVSDQTGFDIAGSSKHKCEEQKQPLSPPGTDNSSISSSNHNNITVRVCADCHTTKTPLWRSGPRGPKSLCNACGIRQRKARRAMAAAASAKGTILMAGEPSDHLKENKLHSKKKKPRIEAPKLKKKRKLGGGKPCSSGSRKKFGFEDLTMSLSKNLALQQDEKEAAILLMALSYGLLHGFPSDRYLDL